MSKQTEEDFFEQELTEKEKASIQFELTLPAVRELLDLKPLQEPTAFCKHGVPKGVCRLGEKDCNASPSWQVLSDDDVKGKLFGIRFDRHTHNLMSNPPQIQYSYTITENELFKYARAIEQASKEKNNAL